MVFNGFHLIFHGFLLVFDAFGHHFRLAVACVAVQLTVESRTEKLPSAVENAMYMSCFALYLQAYF